MATAESVIKRALTKLGIRASESPLTADEVQDGLDQLNDMLSSWEASGMSMGFEPVANASDTIRVPRGALAAIKANLAVYMAAEYGRVVSPALGVEADTTMNDLLRQLVEIGDVDYPSTLPTGSGNDSLDYFDDRFFDEDSKVNW